MRHEYVGIPPNLGNRHGSKGGSAPGADAAYQKLTTFHDTVRYELAMRDFDEALTEIESLLLRAYHGKEDADGGDEDLGDP